MRRLPWLFLCLLLGGCWSARPSANPPRDTHLAQLDGAARRAFTRGALDKAALLYEQALQRARAMDHAAEIADAAYNLAVCQINLGHYPAAGERLQEARAALLRCHGNLADLALVQAKLAYLQGDRQAALLFAEQVLSTTASTPTPSHRLQVLLLRGNLACDAQQATTARALLAEAERHDAPEPVLRAERERLAARLALLDGHFAAAAAAFDRAAASFQAAHHYRAMADALVRAGEAYRLAGDEPRAVDRAARAASSLNALTESDPWKSQPSR
jgi:hypothetical protein